MAWIVEKGQHYKNNFFYWEAMENNHATRWLEVKKKIPIIGWIL